MQCVVDPTRRMSHCDRFHQFSRDEIEMHHFSFVRNDMARYFFLQKQYKTVKVFCAFENFFSLFACVHFFLLQLRLFAETVTCWLQQ
jgi:hypothetical protein